jgi:DUF4097 and DUF4098 domain-containing protein YvlB
MLKTSLIVFVVVAAALLTTSSGSATIPQVGAGRTVEVESSATGEQPGDEVREEFQQSYPLSANGRVALENLNGNVRIAVWDREEVQVNAVKRAYRRERLSEAKIEISATADAIRIRTAYPSWNQTFTDDHRGRYNNPAVVDYTLNVPRKARLESIDLINGSLEIDGAEGDVRASSVNGRVTARGLLGATKLSTVNGSLEATFTSLDDSKPISLGSVNGNVVLIIPSDANANVRANTVHGSISNQFGLEVKHGEYVGHDLYGQIGTGGPRIKLGNVNGGISIRNAKDGRPLSPATGLISEKDKEKEVDREHREQDAEARREAAEARRAERAQERERARSQGEIQAEVQREVERAMREAQREIEHAQREVARETQREIREKTRVGRAAGKGVGKGTGKGTGYWGASERETKSFSVGASPRVNIITFDGDIMVHGWDKPEVTYSATKHGRDEEELKLVRIQTEQQGSALSIIASSEHSSGAASLDVYLPRNATLHVSSGDGNLKLEGISGDLMLRTGDGAIEVVDGGGQLQLNTGDGHIRVSNFDGQVDARTGDGAISLDGKFSGLAARTGDGEISLSVPANLEFTIETNAEGIDNHGLTISEDVAPSTRVRRWKVGRGGNVFVLNTGDGRVVLNSR